MIEIKNCSKTFGEIHAIDHVSMEIGERPVSYTHLTLPTTVTV